MFIARIVAFLCVVLGWQLSLGAAPALPDAPFADERERPFTIAIQNGALQLHPHLSFTVTEAQVFTAIYEGLVSYNPLTLEPEAAVAARWEVSDDDTVYTFHLRDGARYWNGDRVTAQHFREAWLQLLQPDQEAYFSVLFDVIAGATDYRNGVIDDPRLVGIEAVDDGTLRVTLAEPAPFFLSTLCHYSFSPIHPRMRRVADWNSLPLLLTNGPYILKGVDEEALRLTQNGRYWDYDRDDFAEIVFARVDAESDVFARFVNREIDWVSAGFGDDITRYHTALKVNPVLGTGFYFFNAAEPPWDNPDIRRALAIALPWDEIRSRDTYLFPAATLVPPLPDYVQPDGIVTSDTDEAVRLLAASGYEGGAGLAPLVIAIPDNPEDRRIAELMVATWEDDLGVRARIEAVPSAEYFEYVETADGYSLGRISWIGDYLDPLAFLQLWSSDSNLNHAHYRNPEYDRLLRQAARQDGEERAESLGEAERLLIDGALILPINHSVAVNAIDTEQISGWYTNILDIHPVKYLGRQRAFVIPDVARR